VCIHVAPDGNDTLAGSNDGATPFASCKPPSTSPTHTASSPTASASRPARRAAPRRYSGPAGANLTMREGISLLGNYESTTWTRCTNSIRELH